MRRSVVALFVALSTAGPLTAQDTTRRSQLTVDLGPTYAGAVRYAHRVQDSPILIGAGAGVAWELNTHSFERNVWNMVHGEAFARYDPAPWFQGETGLSIATTSPEGDTSEQRMFVGLYAAAMVGAGPLFVGPQTRLGVLDSEPGHITNVAIRFVISVGG